MHRLLSPIQAAQILGISYPTLKQWIYRHKLKTVKTPGGHHRVPESEIDRLIPKKLQSGDIATRRGSFRTISRRNQLMGRVIEIKVDGLLAQVTLAIGKQHITSIISADAARELRLKVGDRAKALIRLSGRLARNVHARLFFPGRSISFITRKNYVYQSFGTAGPNSLLAGPPGCAICQILNARSIAASGGGIRSSCAESRF